MRKWGILKPVRDPKNNYRLYTLEDVRKLAMIRELMNLNLSVEQIKEFDDHRTVHNSLSLLEEKLTETDEQIRQLRAAGKTILLASHDMAEVEELCDRIAILAGGKIVFTGTVEQLHAKMGKHYHLTIRTEEGEETYETDAIGETLLPLLLRYREKGIEINRLRADRGTLEEHFMHIAKGEWG